MQVFAFDTVPSTMLVAQDMAKAIKNESFCVLAKSQEAGIGTQGREWASPVGNFYATFCFKNFQQAFVTKTAIVTGISVVQTLKEHDIKVKLKWTNDIIINDKKVGGILCDFIASDLYIGIGINFKISPANNNKTALLSSGHIHENLEIDYTEFARILGKTISENLIFLKHNGFEEFVPLWQECSGFYNRMIDVELPSGVIKTGIDKGIDNNGCLMLQTSDNTEFFYSARIIKVI